MIRPEESARAYAVADKALAAGESPSTITTRALSDTMLQVIASAPWIIEKAASSPDPVSTLRTLFDPHAEWILGLLIHIGWTHPGLITSLSESPEDFSDGPQ